ncbi:hypothetical protein ACFL2Q_20360 [Thermodesulfobacteriota bacterium]
MKTLSFALGLTLLLVVSPVVALGQGLPIGRIDFAPFVNVGYQKMGVNFSLDGFYSHVGGAGPGQGNLDLRLDGLDLWTGTIGTAVHFGPDFFLFASAEANAEKKISVTMVREPMAGWFTVGPDPVLPGQFAVDPITWTGSGVEWWCLDFGAGFNWNSLFTVLAGVKLDHFTLHLRDARDASGRPLNNSHQIGNIVGSSNGLTVDSDFRSKLTLPYLGVSIRTGNVTGSVIASPLVSAQITLPIRSHGGAFVPFAGGLNGEYEIEWNGNRTISAGRSVEGPESRLDSMKKLLYVR